VYTCTVQYTATTVYLRIRTYESTVQTIFFGECGIQYNIRSQSQSGKLTDWRFLGLPHSARHIHHVSFVRLGRDWVFLFSTAFSYELVIGLFFGSFFKFWSVFIKPPLCEFFPVILRCFFVNLGEGLPSHHLGIFPDLRDANFNQANAFGAPYPKCQPFVSLK
jgi:hypothetical protein